MDKNAKILRTNAKISLLENEILYENTSGKDLKSLIEELSTYQIELEHQNQELLASQEKLLLVSDTYIDLFENAPIGYIIVDTENGINKINKTAYKLLYEGNDTIYCSKFTQLIHPDDQSEYYLYFKSLIKGTPKEYCDLRLFTNNHKTYFYARICGNRQIDSTEQNAEFRLAISDISTEKELELNLIKAKEKAEENDNLKSVFLANMSHEIRTPMNGIIGFTDLLKDPYLSSETRNSYLEIIENSGNRLLDLINELIEISKIEAGQMQANLIPTNITSLLDELHKFFTPEAHKKNITLIIENHLKKSEAKLLTDKDKLYAILVNLTKNSLKYSNAGTIKIGVYKSGPNLKFYVKDTGIGIPKEKKHIIFQRFRQVEETAFHEGTGLGLCIAKALVELLGGTIGFMSLCKKGSTFYFTIPNKKIEIKKVVSIKNNDNAPYLENYEIVIAEDDHYSRMLIDELLRQSKAKTYLVENGVELMSLLEKVNPNLILLDINMPFKNGYECIEEIRKIGIKTKIIAVTAYALNEEKEKILGLGCDGYLAKPFKKQELLSEIEKQI
ncbi:response regulator [Flavobacterium sp. TSSA_36]|uniref:PAS domain-containing hybrid sensor histidine kinase/response regulator n=1 Tax=Flavobacterium sp. TSSA_36 TaxID=3447669 RepID=UPI003F2CF72E